MVTPAEWTPALALSSPQDPHHTSEPLILQPLRMVTHFGLLAPPMPVSSLR